jgi:hypothetical protein
VRGELQASATRAIAEDASIGLLTSLAPRGEDARIETEITQALARGSRPFAAGPGLAGRADVRIGYRYEAVSGDGRPAVLASVDGLERFWANHPAMACPARFDQRLTIAALRGEAGQPGELLWLGELCSDGGGEDPAVHVAAFARELMRGFGMRRARSDFEFLVRAAPTPPEAASGAPDAAVTGAAATAASGPSTAPAGSGVDEMAASPPGAVTGPVSGEERAELGPTWETATQACAALAARPGVGCALSVVVATASPVLELGYASREEARARWRRDLADAGRVFCEVAERHGLREQARLRVTAPGDETTRSCPDVAP